MIYSYEGDFNLDEDLIYSGKLFPKNLAIIKSVIISIKTKENKLLSFGHPKAIIVYNGEVDEIPLNCIFFNNVEYLYDKIGYDGCLYIIPVSNKNNIIHSLGAGIFISPVSRNTLFTQLYLFDKDGKKNKEWEGFEKIYDDSELGYNLMVYPEYNYVKGPIKIWSLNYDSSIKINPYYTSIKVDT